MRGHQEKCLVTGVRLALLGVNTVYSLISNVCDKPTLVYLRPPVNVFVCIYVCTLDAMCGLLLFFKSFHCVFNIKSLLKLLYGSYCNKDID